MARRRTASTHDLCAASRSLGRAAPSVELGVMRPDSKRPLGLPCFKAMVQTAYTL